jgi:hypothetical protein
MWCSTCQQDTPSVAHPASGRTVCSRCQQPVGNKKHAPHARICDEGIPLDEQAATAATNAVPFRTDDWPARQRVRNLARELKRPGIVANKTPTATLSEHRRFEPSQDLLGQFEQTAAAQFASSPTLPPANVVVQPRHGDGSQIVAWLIVTLGTLALAGGVSLIAWSISTKQMMYWDLSLGLALGGQGALILGLVLVVSRLWRHSRYAAGKLHDVHARLGQLQQTAEVLTTMRAGGGAPAFYAELARGSSPHVLLTNLKGQLDQLATRLGG